MLVHRLGQRLLHTFIGIWLETWDRIFTPLFIAKELSLLVGRLEHQHLKFVEVFVPFVDFDVLVFWVIEFNSKLKIVFIFD